MIALINDEHPSLDALFSFFVLAAASLKHEGFHEEREIRIVNSPYTKELDDYLRLHAEDEIEPPQKWFKTIYDDSATGKRYVALFDFNEGRKLPVKRIIVGPHRTKEENAQKVRELVERRVPVHVSATPFIG